MVLESDVAATSLYGPFSLQTAHATVSLLKYLQCVPDHFPPHIPRAKKCCEDVIINCMRCLPLGLSAGVRLRACVYVCECVYEGRVRRRVRSYVLLGNSFASPSTPQSIRRTFAANIFTCLYVLPSFFATYPWHWGGGAKNQTQIE